MGRPAQGGPHLLYVSVGRDVLPKKVQFSESVWDGVYSIIPKKALYKFWERAQIYLSGKGVPDYLEKSC